MKQSKGLVYVAIILAMIFWSYSFIWVKEVYEAYGPLTTVFIRLIIATGLMLLFGWWSKKLVRVPRSDYPIFLLLAFFEPFLYFMGESFGLQYVSSTMGAIIISTIPLFSPMAAAHFVGERLALRHLIGIILSVIGVGLVVFDGSMKLVASPLGIALEFLAVFAAIGYTVVLKNLSSRYNVVSIITYQNLIGIFLFFPFWFLFERSQFFTTPFHLPAFLGIVKLAVFASCLAFILYTYSLKSMGMNATGMFINIIPVITAVLAWFILDEPLSVRKGVGIAIVITGLFVAQVKMKKFIARLVSIQQDGGR